MDKSKTIFLTIFALIFCESLYCQNQSELLNKYKECNKIMDNEMKAVSLENINDIYLKRLLQGFYISVKEDSAGKHSIFDNISICPSIIDSNSILYFKINNGLAKGFEIKITGQDFNKSKHIKNQYCCCMIDNKIFWGTDGDLPSEEIDKFEIKYLGSRISIPIDDYCNLYNPLRFGGGKKHGCIVVDNFKKYVIFVLFGSDGAGTYSAYFIFKDGKYLMRRVERSHC